MLEKSSLPFVFFFFAFAPSNSNASFDMADGVDVLLPEDGDTLGRLQKNAKRVTEPLKIINKEQFKASTDLSSSAQVALVRTLWNKFAELMRHNAYADEVLKLADEMIAEGELHLSSTSTLKDKVCFFPDARLFGSCFLT